MSSSHQIIQECSKATQANIERAIKSFSYLSENQFNLKLNPDSWSVGECISHLVISNNLYLNKIEKILNSYPSSQEKEFPYKQSFFGKLIAKGVDPAYVRKSKTFKVFFPVASEIHKDIIDDYVKPSKKFIELAGRMRNLDLKRIKLSSPVDKLIRLNLGDALIIIPKHDERHLNQAEKVMKSERFPK